MAQFVIIPTVGATETLDAAITSKFGNKAFKLPNGEWLVSFDGTTKQLSDDLTISEGELGVNAVVLNFNGYYGRASKDVWEWISVNSGS